MSKIFRVCPSSFIISLMITPSEYNLGVEPDFNDGRSPAEEAEREDKLTGALNV